MVPSTEQEKKRWKREVLSNGMACLLVIAAASMDHYKAPFSGTSSFCVHVKLALLGRGDILHQVQNRFNLFPAITVRPLLSVRKVTVITVWAFCTGPEIRQQPSRCAAAALLQSAAFIGAPSSMINLFTTFGSQLASATNQPREISVILKHTRGTAE